MRLSSLLLRLLILALALAGTGAATAAPIIVNIDNPNFRKLIVAIPVFQAPAGDAELGKDIALVISGGDTEVDKSVVERIGDLHPDLERFRHRQCATRDALAWVRGVLERELNAAPVHADKHFEVLNFGVGGYSTRDEAVGICSSSARRSSKGRGAVK